MLVGPRIVHEARRAAGLTQVELARRLGTTQSAVARLEKPGANPRVSTINRVLAATGHELDTSLRARSAVDETMIAANLRRSPAQRLEAFQTAYRALRRLAPTVLGSGGS